MAFLNLGQKRLVKFWDNLPRFVRASVWIGISQGIMTAVSYLLEQPEMIKYAGLLNILLVALKEGNDRRREK